MKQWQTSKITFSNFAVSFCLSLRQKIAFLRILPYTFALFYGGNLSFFISTVHLRLALRQEFSFLHFHRTLAPYPTAEFRLSSFSAVHLRLILRQKFVFLHFLPCTCALSYGGNSLFHFPAVHLRHFLRRNFTFLHFPPYICAFLYGGISLFPFPCRTPALFSTAEFHLSSFPAVYFYPFLPQDFTFHGFQPKITAENSSSPLPAVLPYKELFSPSIIFHLKSGEVHPRIIPHPQ